MRYFISLVFFAAIFISAQSQDLLIGQWRSHYSFSNCFDVEETNSQWVGATSGGLIIVEKEDYSISSYSKSEGLSDFGVSVIKGEGDKLFVGYSNGNIDIIENGKVVNINDLKLKVMDGDKIINHFLKIENDLFCATAFGIVVINLEKMETKSTYYIGDNASALKVNQLAYDGEYLYAATEKGVLRALADAPDIHVYSAWSQFSTNRVNYSSIVVLNNQIIAVKGVRGGTVTIEKISESGTTSISSQNYFQNISVKFDQLLIVSSSKVEVYNSNLIDKSTISNPIIGADNISASFKDAIFSDGSIFVADASNGVLSFDGAWIKYLPQGPASNFVQDIKFIGNQLWLVPGGTTTGWDNFNRAASLSVLTSKGWINLTRANTPDFSSAIDLVSITSVLKDPTKVFINSWGSGVFEMDALEGKIEVKNHFFTPENGLVNIFGDHRQYVRVASSAWDNNNVLWVTNSSVKNRIVAYFPEKDEWKRYSYGGINGAMGMAPMLVASNGDKWLVVQRGEFTGLFIWNDNNTPEDESDDYYKSSIPPSRDQDKRNVGQVLLIDRNGEEVTNTIFSMVEDNNRQIWLGTDKGVLVNYQPSSVFSQDVPIFSQIKIPRNDGTDRADYLLGGDAVSAIAVDAGNRKWLGTQGSGVILVSPDGTKQLEVFDVNNSALPSNFITAITIDDKTGEVFFATSEGLVSYKGRATQGEGSFSKIYAFPNPVRPNYSGTITITGLMTNSNVKITDTAGKLVFETTSVGGQAFWDGRNFYGTLVKSGVYLVFVASEDGKSSGVTKIAILR